MTNEAFEAWLAPIAARGVLNHTEYAAWLATPSTGAETFYQFAALRPYRFAFLRSGK